MREAVAQWVETEAPALASISSSDTGSHLRLGATRFVPSMHWREGRGRSQGQRKGQEEKSQIQGRGRDRDGPSLEVDLSKVEQRMGEWCVPFVRMFNRCGAWGGLSDEETLSSPSLLWFAFN